jgi:hypothetical protein
MDRFAMMSRENAMIIERQAGATLTAVEMDPGDELVLHLEDGQVRRIVLTWAGAHVAHRGPLGDIDVEGVISYQFGCNLEIDGVRVNLSRNVPSQENFRDPPRAMGLRIWLDAVDDIFTFLNENHGTCRPRRKCRLAFWDERRRICPELLHPWCPLPEGSLRVEQCYRGRDTWLGPYEGSECHGGLDVNHPAGTPIWAPLRFDEHGCYDRVSEGANNNRWRGVRHWPDGSTWTLQLAHLIRLLVPEGGPLEAGTHYAEGAGVRVGVHEHSHFVFRVAHGEEESYLDPWLLFWQMYQDRTVAIAP